MKKNKQKSYKYMIKRAEEAILEIEIIIHRFSVSGDKNILIKESNKKIKKVYNQLNKIDWKKWFDLINLDVKDENFMHDLDGNIQELMNESTAVLELNQNITDLLVYLQGPFFELSAKKYDFMVGLELEPKEYIYMFLTLQEQLLNISGIFSFILSLIDAYKNYYIARLQTSELKTKLKKIKKEEHVLN